MACRLRRNSRSFFGGGVTSFRPDAQVDIKTAPTSVGAADGLPARIRKELKTA